MIKDQMAVGNMMFSPNTPPGSSGLAMNMDANASQLALLQSFTSEMTIPSQAQLYHHHQPQQPQQAITLPHLNVKAEINNNGDEQMTGGGQ